MPNFKNQDSPELTTNKRELERLWNEGIENDGKYFFLEFELPEHPVNEVIINPAANVEAKMAYIDKMYGGDLRNKHNPDVRIVKFGWFMDMSQLEYVRNNTEEVQ